MFFSVYVASISLPFLIDIYKHLKNNVLFLFAKAIQNCNHMKNLIKKHYYLH